MASKYESNAQPITGVDEHGDHAIVRLFCGRCGIWSDVVRVNAPVRNSADPTETYTLQCGHTVI